MGTTDSLVKSYNSFSGCDIRAVFQDKQIGELQAISYSVTREKAPIYCMGSPDPKAFNRGKRGVAGTMVFVVFDRSALLDALQAMSFLSDTDEMRTYQNYQSVEGVSQPFSSINSLTQVTPATTPKQVPAGAAAGWDQAVMAPFYVDQIPPFSVTLAAANEYGAMSVKKIIGVEILNEGSGCSIDDIVTEEQYTYVARLITPWIPQPSASISVGIGAS